jgi:hypothetical protein
MQSLRDAKCAYCILDTSPVDTEIIEAAINEADALSSPCGHLISISLRVARWRMPADAGVSLSPFC